MDDNLMSKLNEIEQLVTNQIIYNKSILTAQETSKYLDMSLSCVYKLTSHQEIPFYKPNGKKVYFKRTELDDWVLQHKSHSHEEITSKVDNFLSSQKH